MRNYRAMHPPKLARCIKELQAQEGDAYKRVVNSGEDLESHLNAALDAAVSKGVVVPGAKQPEHPDSPPDWEPASPKPAAEPTYIPPQLAYDANGSLAFVPEGVRDQWVMEPKWDGWRWQVHVEADGVRSIGGRNGKKHTGPPAVDAILQDALPAGTIVDGEILWQKGLSSSRIATFVAFDILAVAGSDVCRRPWTERRQLLEKAMENVPSGGCVRIAPYGPVDDAVFARWLELGMEGAVLKRKDAPYRPGTRRRDGFVKVKPQATTDAIVIGYEMGKGASNRERAGALKIRLCDTGAETSCGIDKTEEAAKALIGRRVEVAHYGWIKDSGKVRHPIHKRTRPDLEEAT
jgi:ATP-dependent DNA ligase